MFYVHKHRISQQYGGPEEGGWWYDAGSPVSVASASPVLALDEEEQAYAVARALNEYERERAKREEEYGYTSVLSDRSEHFAYSVSEEAEATAYPAVRPHYE